MRRRRAGTLIAAPDEARDAARDPSRRRIPDLSALPPLLHGTPPFAALAKTLGDPATPPGLRGRHAAITAVPHGAKSFLAAALALAGQGRVCWIARDAEIGDRVADELVAWLGDPAAVAILEPRTALAYERSELVRDESAARVAALAAWRSGRVRVLVASVQALLQPTLAPADLPDVPRALRRGDRQTQGALLAELLRLGYEPAVEVAGRGEFTRRGGLVDIFPAGAELPVRIEFFGDEIDSLRVFDPTDQRTIRTADRVELLPASEFLLPDEGAAGIRGRLGRLAARLPERLAADLARFEAEPPPARRGRPPERRPPERRPTPAPSMRATRRRSGRPSSVRRLGSTTSTPEPCSWSTSPARWRRRPSSCGSRPPSGGATWSPRASCPGSGRTRTLRPATWKARLLAGRTLELTWESGPVEAIGGAAATDDPFGWREPVLPPGRSASLARAIERWRAGSAATVPIADEEAEDGRRVVPPGLVASRHAPGAERSPVPRIVLASDQAPRLGELLADAGIPVGATLALAEAPPPGAVALVARSLNAGFAGGPDGLVVVTDRELFGTVRVRRPKALRRVVPRDILERLTPGDLVVHVDHGIGRYEQMLAPRRQRRGARLPGDQLRRRRPDLRPRRADRPRQPLCRRRAARPSSRLGGGEWARTKARVRKAVADLAAGAARALRGARGRPRGTRSRRTRRGSRSWRRRSRTWRRPTRRAPSREVKARHGGRAADGPARRRRRRLRQDRGRRAGRVQGRSRTAARSRCSCRRPCSRSSTTARSASASPASR